MSPQKLSNIKNILCKTYRIGPRNVYLTISKNLVVCLPNQALAEGTQEKMSQMSKSHQDFEESC